MQKMRDGALDLYRAIASGSAAVSGARGVLLWESRRTLSSDRSKSAAALQRPDRVAAAIDRKAWCIQGVSSPSTYRNARLVTFRTCDCAVERQPVSSTSHVGILAHSTRRRRSRLPRQCRPAVMMLLYRDSVGGVCCSTFLICYLNRWLPSCTGSGAQLNSRWFPLPGSCKMHALIFAHSVILAATPNALSSPSTILHSALCPHPYSSPSVTHTAQINAQLLDRVRRRARLHALRVVRDEQGLLRLDDHDPRLALFPIQRRLVRFQHNVLLACDVEARGLDGFRSRCVAVRRHDLFHFGGGDLWRRCVRVRGKGKGRERGEVR